MTESIKRKTRERKGELGMYVYMHVYSMESALMLTRKEERGKRFGSLL